MEKPLRVSILGREFTLRVSDEDEELMRDVAAYVDGKMQAFRQAHPNQPEITNALMTSLAIAEELYAAWEEQDELREVLGHALDGFADRLDGALEPPEAAPAEAPAALPAPGQAGSAPPSPEAPAADPSDDAAPHAETPDPASLTE